MPTKRLVLALGAMFAWLMVVALVHPISIDEGQYVGATKLVAAGLLPYRDFAYLQTPLQPLLFAPFELISGGHLYLISRMLNAVLGATTLLFVYKSALKIGASKGAALAATALLLASSSFIWSATVARNDMLPAALFAVAMYLLLQEQRQWMLLIGGLFLGLAASAKISYAVPTATMICAGFWPGTAIHARRFISVAAGAAIGILPTLALAAIAPRAFEFGVLVFSAKAPSIYYSQDGRASLLGWHRILDLLATAAAGPALLAMFAIAKRSTQSWKKWMEDRNRRLLLAAIVGGLMSAILNKPFHPPYLVPALPPLFVLLAQVFSGNQMRLEMRVAWIIFAAVGFVPSIQWLGHAALQRSSPAVAVEMTSAKLGQALRRAQVDGPIATLEGQYIVDSGYALDPRFAAGPFVFRASQLVSATDGEAWHVVTLKETDQLSVSPPAAFVTGNLRPDSLRIETKLGSIASALGFSPIGRFDGLTIWIRTGAAVRPPRSAKRT